MPVGVVSLKLSRVINFTVSLWVVLFYVIDGNVLYTQSSASHVYKHCAKTVAKE